jgi:NADH-quinone oxidoreductase subunit L
MLISTAVVACGIGLGWWLYLKRPRERADSPDVLESWLPKVHRGLQNRWYVDELYDATVVRAHRLSSLWSGWADRLLIGGLVTMTGAVFRGLAWLARWADEYLVNPGFDAGCGLVRTWGWLLSRLQGGRLQRYLGGLALGMVVLTLLLVWGLGTG